MAASQSKETWHFNSTHFPFKLNQSNYLTWKSSVTFLLVAHSLLGFVDGTITEHDLPTTGATETQKTTHTKRQTQDHAIKHALMSSITKTVVPFIASAKTSRDIWQSLQNIFCHKSRSHILNLKTEIQHAKQGSQSVTEYLYHLQTIPDTLNNLGKPVDPEDFILYTLNGLRSEYSGIADVIRNSENEYTFDTLLANSKTMKNTIREIQESPLLSQPIMLRAPPPIRLPGKLHRRLDPLLRPPTRRILCRPSLVLFLP